MVVIGLSILAMTMWTARSEAHCFSIWHYKTPQRCGSIRYLPHGLQKQLVPDMLPPERTVDIPIPALDFEACPDGGERMQGIAKLHALYDGL